jgi:hypothetical protein
MAWLGTILCVTALLVGVAAFVALAFWYPFPSCLWYAPIALATAGICLMGVGVVREPGSWDSTQTLHGFVAGAVVIIATLLTWGLTGLPSCGRA